MKRIRAYARLALLSFAVVLVCGSYADAQGRRQRGGPGGGFGGFGGGLGAITNEYLQSELGLTAAQKKRITEIELQLAGVRALSRDDVIKELGITDGQKKQMEEVQTAQRDKFRELFRGLGGRRGGGGGAGGNREELMKKFQAMRTDNEKAMMGVLSSSQRARFEQMKGKPIDVEKLRRRPGGNRRQRPARPDV